MFGRITHPVSCQTSTRHARHRKGIPAALRACFGKRAIGNEKISVQGGEAYARIQRNQPGVSFRNAGRQEMDIFAEEEEKMGRTIYDPSTWRENAWPENSREAWKKLGEYRIFADTSERVPRYDIFADGNGK